jgi:zinc transporter ZupT
MTSPGPSRRYSGWLALTALSYAVLHHLGLVPAGFGAGPDGTRWADWLDLAVPWLVLAPAAMTMRAADATTPVWVLFGAGVVAYTSGHGIHLAANSVGNDHPGQTAHLWDEVVGHYVWFVGVALILLALTLMIGRPRSHPIGYALAVAAGLTWPATPSAAARSCST